MYWWYTHSLCYDRYEIRDIRLPERIQEAMQMQVKCDNRLREVGWRLLSPPYFRFFKVEAERKKRAAILESEGIRFLHKFWTCSL